MAAPREPVTVPKMVAGAAFGHCLQQWPTLRQKHRCPQQQYSFGVFSHCKSFGLSVVLWGKSVLGRQNVPRKVPPRSRQGSSEVPAPRSHQGSHFVVSLVLWGRFALVLKGSVEPNLGSTKVSARFQHGCASFVISLAFSAKSVLGSQKVLWKVPP